MVAGSLCVMAIEQLTGATCARYDPEIWFEKWTQALAKELCSTCPVQLACLRQADREEADEPYIFGVRGGLTAAARARTRRLRCAA